MRSKSFTTTIDWFSSANLIKPINSVLDKCKLEPTYNILKNYGNMSSPTVLFVIKEVLEKVKPEHKGSKAFAAAFGPGLSIETMQLQYV